MHRDPGRPARPDHVAERRAARIHPPGRHLTAESGRLVGAGLQKDLCPALGQLYLFRLQCRGYCQPDDEARRQR